MNKYSRTFPTVLITILVTVLVLSAAGCIYLAKHDVPMEKLVKVMQIVEDSYVGKYDAGECETNAISAVLATIGDDYAVYYDEKSAAETMQMIDGYYVGIGVEVFANSEKGMVEIISAYEDSPADKAGMKNGDLIKSVDGKEYTASMMDELVLSIKGAGVKDPLNTVMKIVVVRGDKEISMELKREKIDMYKVESEIIDDICYIRYTGFTEDSENAVEKIVDSLDEEQIKGIVFDIRNNPGGELYSAIDLCDLFLEDELIMYTENKQGERTEYKAKKGSCKIPLALIVNGSSASASEVFAGAMQDNDRAVIVGEKTYGKGVSQTVKYINPADKSEGALKLTTFKNFTPDGRWINESIIPDIEIKTEKVQGDIRNDAAFLAAANSLKKEK